MQYDDWTMEAYSLWWMYYSAPVWLHWFNIENYLPGQFLTSCCGMHVHCNMAVKAVKKSILWVENKSSPLPNKSVSVTCIVFPLCLFVVWSSSHFNLHLQNHMVHWNKTWHDCLLDGTLQNEFLVPNQNFNLQSKGSNIL